jgi:hypothetical protein
MMMHALSKGGIPAVYEESKNKRIEKWRRDDYDPNPDGLFELTKARLYRMFPNDLEGYLVKIADFQWSKLKGQADGIRVVYMLRGLDSVVKSFKKMVKGISVDKVVDRHARQAKYISQIQGRPDVISLNAIWYEAVLAQPMSQFELLKDAGWPIDVRKAAAVVNPDYCHFGGEA